MPRNTWQTNSLDAKTSCPSCVCPLRTTAALLTDSRPRSRFRCCPVSTNEVKQMLERDRCTDLVCPARDRHALHRHRRPASDSFHHEGRVGRQGCRGRNDDSLACPRCTGRASCRLASELPVEERGRTHYRVSWALPVDSAARAPERSRALDVVHAPTITDERLDLPATLIADLPLDPSRRRVRAGDVTRPSASSSGE